MTRNTAVLLVKLAITAAAVLFLFSSKKLELSNLSVVPAGWSWIAAAGCLVLSQMLILQVRFWVLLRALGVHVRAGRSISAGFISWFLNATLLGGFGFLSSDAVRGAYLIRDSSDFSAIVGASLLDRIVGLAGLLTVCAIGILIGLRFNVEVGDLSLASLTPYALLTLSILAAILLSVMRLSQHVSSGTSPMARVIQAIWRATSSILHATKSIASHRRGIATLIAAYLSAIVTHCLVVLAIFMLGRAIALEYAPSIAQIVFAAPVALLTAILPLPANGLGVGEIAFDSLLRLFPSPDFGPFAGGAALYLSYRIVATVMALAGLPLFLSSRKRSYNSIVRA